MFKCREFSFTKIVVIRGSSVHYNVWVFYFTYQRDSDPHPWDWADLSLPGRGRRRRRWLGGGLGREVDLPARDLTGESSPKNHGCTRKKTRSNTCKNNLKNKNTILRYFKYFFHTLINILLPSVLFFYVIANFPPSIRHQDLNPRPIGYKSPLTTRPWLLALTVQRFVAHKTQTIPSFFL